MAKATSTDGRGPGHDQPNYRLLPQQSLPRHRDLGADRGDEQAIVHEGEEDFVFVQEDEGVFHRREVTIQKGARGRVQILRGVDPGEQVVVSGTFTLKSIARSAELGEGHSH